MRVTDRSKDVIKSGGEWISSIDIENILYAYPGVRLAAVVGIFHPKWEERPVLIVETEGTAVVDKVGLLDFLSARVPRWWLPDDIIFQPIPLTSTGKVDKKRSEEHKSELQSLMSLSYAVFCLTTKQKE